MSPLPAEFYARWRAQNEARLLLREPAGETPPERLLQSVWHHQRLRRAQLQTTDGRPVRVLHPGFWNHGAGPDFRGAVLRIGTEDARAGDVEIDLTQSNWHSHHHQGNPEFGNVILHVVWKAPDADAGERAVLALEPYLESPLAEMRGGLEGPASAGWPDALRGACSAPLAALEPGRAGELLLQAAQIRFDRKGAELEARAREAGWEQTLWEGLFRALGYKQNTWPMLRLAELLPRLSEGDTTVVAWQARLLGAAGLLDLAHDADADATAVQLLWHHWWREREKFHDAQLPKALWRLNGIRPANHPQRRLALAAHWLASGSLIPRLESWFVSSMEPGRKAEALQACLQPPEDPFWSWHWTFRSPRLTRAQLLMGEDRATDIAVNVILPWFYVRARTGRNTALAESARRLFMEWPASQDNSVLRLARQRLLGRIPSRFHWLAGHQQGLLQIVRDFCDHSNAVCDDCQFPELVRQCAAH